jgi:hypothetical protein
MLPNIKRWDVDKINSLFPREVALDIVAVPLLDVVKEDRLVWKEEKDGLYSVRSGYRKFLKEKGRGVGGDSIDGWSSLWKIHAPPKAKHLLWRICRECLPTRSRLINRFVPCPVECPLCLNNDEEESHLFFNCDSIREAWHVMGLANIIQSRSHLLTNVRDLICDICRNEPKMEAGKVVVLLWFAWQNRNNKVWNDACLQGAADWLSSNAILDSMGYRPRAASRATAARTSRAGCFFTSPMAATPSWLLQVQC